MKSYNRGINLIELLVAITITAILAVPMVNALRNMLATWQKGSNQLESIKTSHLYLDPLSEKLRYAVSIDNVSLSTNLSGYIQFTDVMNRSYTVIHNSEYNKTYFNIPNEFPNDSLIFFLNNETPSPELLLQHITSFSFETYAEDSSLFFKVVSANNTSASPDYTRIISVKIMATVLVDSFEESVEHLIDLAKTPFESSNSIEIGGNIIPFIDMSYDSDSVEINDNFIAFNGDVLSLPYYQKTVKLLHTSRYFDSISEALDVAVEGDVILVAYLESGYTENFIIPEGVTIRGGYNPQTWERDLTTYPSILHIREGINLVDSISSIIAMNNNTTIDGFVFDSKDLSHAIYASNADNISIINCQFNNVDTAIKVNNTSGFIIQNIVSSNITSLSASNSEQLVVKRNIFRSFNQLTLANILLDSISNSLFVNNLISGGHIGLSLTDSLNITIANNAITQADYFGLTLENLLSTSIYNNIIAKNNIGVFFESASIGDFDSNDFTFNFLANNEFGHLNNLLLNASNIAVTLSDYIWENVNPYFSNNSQFILSLTSSLIDAGFGANETYFNGNPSLGNATNDIGVYGGPYSGRVGIPNKVTLSNSLSSAELHNLITQSYPGDLLFFDSGTVDIYQTIELKPYQYLGGILSDLSLLNHMGSSYLVELADNVLIEQLAFLGNQKSTLLIDSVSPYSVSQLIFNDASNAITLATTSANIQFSSFYNCSVGINIANDYSGAINYNIFESNTLAINNNTILTTASSHNLFYDNDTLYSGSVNENDNITNVYSSFRAPDLNRFELIASSNAIDKHLFYDAGAQEFFHHYGRYITQPFNPPIDRYYKTLRVDFDHPADTLQVLSGVSIGFINNDKSITLNQTIIIDSENIDSITLDLPPSIIADDMQLIIQLDSFTFGRSPYIDDITLSW